MRPPVQVSEKNVCEAAVVEDVANTASHGAGADVFAHEPRTDRREQHPVLPIDSQPTGARQRNGGASDKLGGPRQVVRRASTTEEVTLMNGHHGAQLPSPGAYETLLWPVVAHQVQEETALAALQLQPRAKRAADGVTEAVCGVGRAQSHTELDNLFLKKLSQGAGAIELMVDVLPAGVPRIARLCRLVCGLPSKEHARPGPGRLRHATAEPRRYRRCASLTRSPVSPPPEELAAEVPEPLRIHCGVVLHPARHRESHEVNSRRPGGRGRPVPVKDVLLLVALLPWRRPDDEDGEQLLFCGWGSPTHGVEPCEPSGA